MSKSLEDVLRQPLELSSVLDRLTRDEARLIYSVAESLDLSRPIYIIGIGSSYNIAIAVSVLFQAGGIVAIPVDASEFLHFFEVPEAANAIILSRSGKSVEIVQLLEKFKARNAHIVAVTNTPDSPLGRACDTVIDLGAAFDHNVSFTMYAALGLAAGLVAMAARGTDVINLAVELKAALHESHERMPGWRSQIEQSAWIADMPTYFLARGTSVSTCHEARLLWEEVAKAPASALPTGGFRHGSQEIIQQGLRVGLWIDPRVLREGDLRLAADLEAAGVAVMCIGEGLSGNEATLCLDVPPTPAGWQFLVDCSPSQLASVELSRRRGVDPDTFVYCSFIVEGETGLNVKAVA